MESRPTGVDIQHAPHRLIRQLTIEPVPLPVRQEIASGVCAVEIAVVALDDPPDPPRLRAGQEDSAGGIPDSGPLARVDVHRMRLSFPDACLLAPSLAQSIQWSARCYPDEGEFDQIIPGPRPLPAAVRIMARSL